MAQAADDDALGRVLTPDERANANLDRVATTLIGAVAAVGGLLAALGVNNERVNYLLDDDSAKGLLLAAGALAILAVFASLAALMAKVSFHEVIALGVGAVAYVGALLCALFSAAGAADYAAHPAVTSVSLAPGPPAELSLTIQAGSLDETQSVLVQVTGATADDEVFASAMKPDDRGHVEQQLTVPLPEGLRELTVMAWRGDQSTELPGCTSGRANVVCARVVLP